MGISGHFSRSCSHPITQCFIHKSQLPKGASCPLFGMSQQQEPDSPGAPNKPELTEVLPKAGLVYSEKGNLSEVLCKPKIMPIKSMTLEKLESMEAEARRQTSVPATAMANK